MHPVKLRHASTTSAVLCRLAISEFVTGTNLIPVRLTGAFHGEAVDASGSRRIQHLLFVACQAIILHVQDDHARFQDAHSTEFGRGQALV